MQKKILKTYEQIEVIGSPQYVKQIAMFYFLGHRLSYKKDVEKINSFSQERNN